MLPGMGLCLLTYGLAAIPLGVGFCFLKIVKFGGEVVHTEVCTVSSDSNLLL